MRSLSVLIRYGAEEQSTTTSVAGYGGFPAATHETAIPTAYFSQVRARCQQLRLNQASLYQVWKAWKSAQPSIVCSSGVLP